MQHTSSQLNTDHGVKVTAQTIFLDEYSKPEKKHFLFCYKINIKNDGENTVKLLNRHWVIIDSESHRSEVKGPGVVGLQPVLAPGQGHEYFSFCNLETNFGTMEGNYEMQDEDDGGTFLVAIPRFYLADTLNQFPGPTFKRGQVVRNKKENYRAVITDYDMYFINDEELYSKATDRPERNKPWYYVLIDKTNAISYLPQEQLELAEEQEGLDHPLLDFFFDGFDGEKYKRNDKTWEQLKRA